MSYYKKIKNRTVRKNPIKPVRVSETKVKTVKKEFKLKIPKSARSSKGGIVTIIKRDKRGKQLSKVVKKINRSEIKILDFNPILKK